MKGLEVLGLLDDKSAANHPGFVWFLDEMLGRQYGHEALNDAWIWFRTGWEACVTS